MGQHQRDNDRQSLLQTQANLLTLQELLKRIVHERIMPLERKVDAQLAASSDMAQAYAGIEDRLKTLEEKHGSDAPTD